MARRVYTFPRTWQDKHYKKDLARFNPKQRKKLLENIAGLITALSNCTHPTSDPILQRWDPSPYKRVIRQGGVYEYRGLGLTRVIARWVEADPDNQLEEAVLLLTVTVKHDHDRMQTLIQSNEHTISTWKTPQD